MMNTKEIEKIKHLIPDYISGKLSRAEKELVERYIESTPELKKFYTEIEAAFKAVDNIRFNEPSPQYWINLLPRIHQRIEDENLRRVKNPIAAIWKYLVPAAAVILIILLYKIVTNDSAPQLTKEDIKENLKVNELDTMRTEVTPNKIKKERKPTETKKYALEHKIYKQNLKDEKVNYENVKKAENYILKELEKELTVTDLSTSILPGIGEAGSIDEETENELNKLGDTEKEKFLEKLKQSNL